MSFFSKAKGLSLILIGAAGGAAAAYYLDPDRGNARRSQAKDQVGAAIRDQADQARQQLDYQAGVAKGAVAERVTDLSGPKDLNDASLKQKVETEILGRPDVPKGDVLIDVADGIVTLRGTIGTGELRQRIEEATRSIPEVRGVDNLLQLTGASSSFTAN